MEAIHSYITMPISALAMLKKIFFLGASTLESNQLPKNTV
jgi:hypothetical protein